MRMDVLTVGQIKEYLKKWDLPDDTPVLYERHVDKYFTDLNWKTHDVDWETVPWSTVASNYDYFTNPENADKYELRYADASKMGVDAWGVPQDMFYGENGEHYVEQAQAVSPSQVYKTWSRTLGCYVLMITAHY
jgi:hypothetical protein